MGGLALPFGWRYIIDSARGFSPNVRPSPGPDAAITSAASTVKAVRTIYENLGEAMDGSDKAREKVVMSFIEALNEGMGAGVGNPLSPIERRALREYRRR